jgi:hypothetical protein
MNRPVNTLKDFTASASRTALGLAVFATIAVATIAFFSAGVTHAAPVEINMFSP